MLPNFPGGLALCALAAVLALAGGFTWRGRRRRHKRFGRRIKTLGLPWYSACRRFCHSLAVVQERFQTDQIADLPGNLQTGFYCRGHWGDGFVTTLTASLKPCAQTRHAVLRPWCSPVSASPAKRQPERHLLLLQAGCEAAPLTIAETTDQLEPGTKVFICGYRERAPDRMVQYENEATITMVGTLDDCRSLVKLAHRRMDAGARFMVLALGGGCATEGSPVILDGEVIGMVSYVAGNNALVIAAEEIYLMLVAGILAK